MTNAKRILCEIPNESSGWEHKVLTNFADDCICDGGPDESFVPTPDELKLLKLMAQGKPPDEISEELDYSATTVTIYIRALMARMGACSPANAIAIAFLEDILTKDSFNK